MKFSVRLLMILLSVVALSAIGMGSFWFALTYFSRGDDVRVPNIKGLELAQALSVVQERQLQLYLDGEEYNDNVPVGLIASQAPKPGQRCKPGRKIRVIVSKGQAKIIMPNIVGAPLRQAALTIERLGLIPDKVIRISDSQSMSGRVIATNPTDETNVDSGQMVTFVVSEGDSPQCYVMPAVVGKGLEEVTSLFAKAGIELTNTRYRSTGGAVDGMIISQIPSPGMPVEKAQDIQLTVQGTMTAEESFYEFSWKVPQDFRVSRIRVLLVQTETTKTLWDRNAEGGEVVTVKVPWVDKAKIHVYLNDSLVYVEQL